MSNMSKAAAAQQHEAERLAAMRKTEQLAAARKQAKELKAAREVADAAAAEAAAAEAAAALAKTVAEEKAKFAAYAAQPKPAAATFEELGLGDFEIPSWKRVLVGFILGVASAGAVGYGIGMVAAYCIAGIMMLTTSAGIALFMSFLVWLLAIYASWKIGGYVGGKVFASVVLPDGLASRAAASVSNAASDAKSAVAGWFTSKPAVAQFTGAHKVAAAS